MTYGRNLAQGKPYTVTVPSTTQWGAGDPDGRRLTDGIGGPPYPGGRAPGFAANHFWPDDETLCVHLFELILPKPVEARYVRFAITPARTVTVSEVDVLEFICYEPFDLRLAMPDAPLTEPGSNPR